MMHLDRTNNTLLGRWWWTVDRTTLLALVALIGAGVVLVTAASPAVATRLGLDPFYFVRRQQFFLTLGLLTMVSVSLLSPPQVRKLAAAGLLISLFLMAVVPFIGTEVKGARRWINLLGVSLQPSEFMKPCFAVTTAWLLAQIGRRRDFPARSFCLGLYLLVVVLLLLEPDFGMTVTVTFMWGMQCFLAGLPVILVGLLTILGAGGVWLAYLFFPHVTKRIDGFLDPSSGDNYQVARSLEAFQQGSLFGRGPGEGIVKRYVPDAHTDFIFSVAGEEFGLIVCLLIVGLFALIVLRGFVRVWGMRDPFILLAVSGLLAQFGIQSVINMGVAINLLPAKGMTLPFLSYGGSSLLAIALGMGMLLALTRRRYGDA